MNKVLITGWINQPHSFAYVNLEHISALLKLECDVFFQERSPLFSNWLNIDQDHRPINDFAYKGISDKLKKAVSGKTYDFTLDMAVPPSPPPYLSSKSAIFMVSEYGNLSKDYIKMCGGIETLLKKIDLVDYIVTPSSWSKDALVRSRIPENKIVVIHHGVRKNYLYNQSKPINNKIKSALSIPDNFLTVLHIGTPTWNKGPDIMLEAIAQSDYARDICLIYKGNDAIYGTKDKFVETMNKISAKYGKTFMVKYIGSHLPKKSLSDLIMGSDIYMSLFRAEGFNLPVAEAASLGKQLVVSQCPPVTEFLVDTSATNWVQTKVINSQYGLCHEPDLSSAVISLNAACKKVLESSSLDAVNNAANQKQILDWQKVGEYLTDLF